MAGHSPWANIKYRKADVDAKRGKLWTKLSKAIIGPDSKQLTRIPSNTVEISEVETAKNVLALMDALDDHDDVQSVAANFTIPDEAMAVLGQS